MLESEYGKIKSLEPSESILDCAKIASHHDRTLEKPKEWGLYAHGLASQISQAKKQ